MTDKPEFQKYPQTMTHPAYRPATISKGEAGMNHGQPQMFPPVTVRDETEEDYYRAQGYEPAGTVDPAAWAQQHSGGAPALYVPQEYPKWVDGRVVNSIDEDPTIDAEAKVALKAAEAAMQAPAPHPAQAEFEARIAALEAALVIARETPAKTAYRGGGRRKARPT